MHSSAEPVKFQPYASSVDFSFWHELTKRKLDTWHLSEERVTLRGSFAVRGAGTSGLPLQMRVTGEGFSDLHERLGAGEGQVRVAGSLWNTNTVEGFQGLDRKALVDAVCVEMSNAVETGLALKDPMVLQRFIIICFADLKRYKFLYWFAFPSLQCGNPTLECAPQPFGTDEREANFLRSWRASEAAQRDGVGFFRAADGSVLSWTEGPLGLAHGEDVTLGLMDGGTLADYPGWAARSVLAYIFSSAYPRKVSRLTLICVRGLDSTKNWRVFKIDSGVNETNARLEGVAMWERDHKQRNKPQLVNLSDQMDPVKVNATAVDLNLKLMKWRLAPELDLAGISAQRCLLFGAGTLGCHVARALLGWGVRSITFVDSGRVSHSNPVRQSLFEFNDCLDGGRPKAEAAAAACKRVFPECNAKGIQCTIPMPGHPMGEADVKQSMAILQAAVNECDVLFLLTDSREARWLGTVLGAVKRKIVINAALGFDSYLVMRHGNRSSILDSITSNATTTTTATTSTTMTINVDMSMSSSADLSSSSSAAISHTSSSPVLGCYFCSDVVAPTDSLRNRTLDQQCTVSRPGVSFMASALAVELLVSVLQSPLRDLAPADTGKTNSESTGNCLGIVPHQMRGFLSNYSNLLVVGHAYDRCTACSRSVLEGFVNDPVGFVSKCCTSASFLEDITGLTDMKNESVDFESADEDFSME